MFLPKFDVDPAAARRPARSARSGPCIADHGEYFTPTIGSCGTTSPAGRCSTSAPTRSPSPTWILGDRRRCWPPASRIRRESTGRCPPSSPTPPATRRVLNTTIFSNTPTTAVVAGTAATLTIPGPFYQPGAMTLTLGDRRGADLLRRAADRARGAALRGGRGGALHHLRACWSHRCGRWPTPSPRCGWSTRSAGTRDRVRRGALIGGLRPRTGPLSRVDFRCCFQDSRCDPQIPLSGTSVVADRSAVRCWHPDLALDRAKPSTVGAVP